MTGRENPNENDLFFVCSLIDYIGRKTKNYRSTVVNALGMQELQHLYDYADVYHCENIDKVSDELILKKAISTTLPLPDTPFLLIGTLARFTSG